MIPQTNPLASYLEHKEEIDAATLRVLSSGRYILGEEVTTFEHEFASFLNAKSCIGVASGTDALILALKALEIRPGDAVITVSHTAVATVAAIEAAGAVPVLVDVDPETFTLCPKSLADTISSYNNSAQSEDHPLAAVIAVHLYGHPADLTSIISIAEKHKLKIIEDCAQAHGASWSGRQVGTFGHAAAFSFYPTKNLGGIGDGGAVATSLPAVAERIKLLREYGWKERYVSHVPSQNSRLDELQAAILRVKLRSLKANNERRQQLALTYSTHLQNIPLSLPTTKSVASHVYHQYVVTTDKRDLLRSYLSKQETGTLIHYPCPIHLQPAYRDRLFLDPSGLKTTKRLAHQVLSLPMFPQMKKSDAEKVATQITSFFKN
jgi:dTDP-4-amino-4,6-dideoxygalactose transaminase